MNPILTLYDVHFFKKSTTNGFEFVARGGGAAEFLSTLTDEEYIKEGIDNVIYYLSGGTDDYEKCTVSAELYTAWLDNETADIYPSTGNTEHLLQTIPLADFKVILELWLAFLSD